MPLRPVQLRLLAVGVHLEKLSRGDKSGMLKPLRGGGGGGGEILANSPQMNPC